MTVYWAIRDISKAPYEPGYYSDQFNELCDMHSASLFISRAETEQCFSSMGDVSIPTTMRIVIIVVGEGPQLLSKE